MKIKSFGADVEFLVSKNGTIVIPDYTYNGSIGRDEGMVEVRPEKSECIYELYNNFLKLVYIVIQSGYNIELKRWCAGGHLHIQTKLKNSFPTFPILVASIPHIALQGPRLLYSLSIERRDHFNRIESRFIPSLLWFNKELILWSLRKIKWVIENIETITVDEVLDYSEILPEYRRYVEEICGNRFVFIPSGFSTSILGIYNDDVRYEISNISEDTYKQLFVYNKTVKTFLGKIKSRIINTSSLKCNEFYLIYGKRFTHQLVKYSLDFIRNKIKEVA